MTKKLDDKSWLEKTHKEACAWLTDRLQDAVETHDLLPGPSHLRLVAMFNNITLPEDDVMNDSPRRKYSADADDIRRMEEVFSWFVFISGKNLKTKRRKQNAVYLRSRKCRGNPLPWRVVKEGLGVSHVTAQQLYEEAFEEMLFYVRKLHTKNRLPKPV